MSRCKSEGECRNPGWCRSANECHRDSVPKSADKPAPTPRTAEEKIVSALRMVSDLCDKRREWTMSIPARPDYDPDLVIADALYTAKYELSAARAEAERLREEVNLLRDTYAEHRSVAALAATRKEEGNG